jgi:DNA-binding MarR family transcriptional regulator
MAGLLQRELNKKNAFDVPEQEVFLNLLRTTSLMENIAERFFRVHGLSIATYNVLRILRSAGKDGKTCSQVGEDMVARVPDVTRLVDRLEEAGMVKRARERDDRRVVRVTLTPKGLELLTKLDEPVVELHRQQLGHMSKAELTELSRLLERSREPEMNMDAPK